MNNWITDPISTYNGQPFYYLMGESVLVCMINREGLLTIATATDFDEADPTGSIMQTVFQAQFATQQAAMTWWHGIKNAEDVVAAAYANSPRPQGLNLRAQVRLVMDNWGEVLVANVVVIDTNSITIRVRGGQGRTCYIRRENLRKEDGYWLVKDCGSTTVRAVMADGLVYSTISEAIR